MTHLNIQQDNTVTEEVTSKIIERLYNAVHDSTLDNTSQLVGRLHTTVGYEDLVLYLNTRYQGLLYILSDNYAIKFEDPNMLHYLNSMGIGGDGYVTVAQAAAVLNKLIQHCIPFITKFNELKYFTNVTSGKGGYSGSGSGYTRFYNWTALEEIDISNFITIGHNNSYAYEDTFSGCTSLKTVTASDKLENIGYGAFKGCSNLEDIIGLSSNINVYNYAFYNCSKLKNETFLDAAVNITGSYAFSGCSLLSSMQLSSNMTTIPEAAFKGCTSLLTITGASNITLIQSEGFRGCTSLSSLDISGTIDVRGNAFNGCTGLTGNAFSNASFLLSGGGNVFAGCSGLTQITLSADTLNVGSGAFHSCTNLQTITNSSYITIVGNGSFARCTNLTSLNLSNLDLTDSTVLEAFWSPCNYNFLFLNCNNLTTIGINTFPNITRLASDVFADCRSLTGSLNFPDLTTLNTSNYGRLFRNCELLTKLSFGHITQWGTSTSLDAARGMATGCINLKILDLGDSVGAVYTHNCYKDTALEAVLINISTPPTISGNNNTANNILARLFGNSTVNVYVPDSAVSTYQAADGWSKFSSNIKPMSQYNESAILAS